MYCIITDITCKQIITIVRLNPYGKNNNSTYIYKPLSVLTLFMETFNHT